MIDAVAITLTLLYAGLAFLGLYLLLDIPLTNNKKYSQKNFIITFLTLGFILRVVFWAKVCVPTTVSPGFLMAIFFLPLWLNFVGLSGLAIFYAKALDYIKYFKNIWRYIFVSACILLLVLNIVISVSLADDALGPRENILTISYTIYATCLDLVLAISLGYLGHKFKQLKIIRSLLPTSVAMFSLVNWIVVICYSIRGIFTSLFLLVPPKYSNISFNGDHPATSVVTLFFLLIAELAPNFCVLILLMQVQGSKQSRYASFTVKSLDRLLDLTQKDEAHNDIWQDSQSLLSRTNSLVDTLILDESKGIPEGYLITNNRASWSDHFRNSFEPSNVKSESNLEYNLIVNESADTCDMNDSRLSENGTTHRLSLNEGGISLSPNLGVFMQNDESNHGGSVRDAVPSRFHSPSPQLIQVGTSYESSPGGADVMWQHIFSRQATTNKLSVASAPVSALHRPPMTPIQVTSPSPNPYNEEDKAIAFKRTLTPSLTPDGTKDNNLIAKVSL